PETSKKLLGIVKSHQAHPLKGVAETLALTMLWILSGATTSVMFVLDSPRGLRRANERSRRLCAIADTHNDSVERRALYQRALELATDRELIAHLQVKLLNTHESAATGGHIVIDSQTLIDNGRTAKPTRQTPDSLGPSGRYTLEAEIGRGAMGVVYRAWDTALDRQVAIKQLSQTLTEDEQYAARFRREAKALARLTHPHVVQVYDLIEDSSRLWMALEFVDGGDLAGLLKREGPLSAERAVSLISAVAAGLAFAHNQGIIHRDLKPSNILLTGDLTPKVSDFGIAKLAQSSELTQAGAVLGSPRYMSPEQCGGEMVDTRSDIYSLGISLYELLSGAPPFTGSASHVLARHLTEIPTSVTTIRQEVPERLEQIISRMLAKDPTERPESMASLIELLAPFTGRTSAVPTPIPSPSAS
ncbi:MAG TPA: serine/threonine-protein kinase, partial [candidate division Zixibacteria bacterium]|nr:serine/threonine-protein kinase [candidate division Zixibacteria bacterium]